MAQEREVTTHKVGVLNEAIKITAVGDPGPGGAFQHYTIEIAGLFDCHEIVFQQGDPHQDINGISNEALLAIVHHRLRGFHQGPFDSHPNREALAHVGLALEHLHSRTRERQARGVEGQQAQ